MVILYETSYRPWGEFAILYRDDKCVVKRLVVNPNQRTSLQSHQGRDEDWRVITGTGIITIEYRNEPVGPGDVFYIPAGVRHRIAGTGDEPLVIIEIWTGDKFDENDIERFEDDYNRVGL